MTTALLLIDIQNDYFPGGRLELDRMTEAAAKAADLSAQFRQKEQPIFHVRHLSLGDDAGFFHSWHRGLRNQRRGDARSWRAGD